MNIKTPLLNYSKSFDYCSDVPCEKETQQIASDAKRLCGIDGSEWLHRIFIA